jgi:hypothetical protein
MAATRRKGDASYCTFRYGGRRFYFPIGNVTERQARANSVEGDKVLIHYLRTSRSPGIKPLGWVPGPGPGRG